MTNRDTLIPVCKIVAVASGTTGGIHLGNTAVELTNVAVYDEQHNKQTAGASGLVEGNQTFFVSGNAGGTITSGSVVVRVQGGRVVTATVKDGGAYNGASDPTRGYGLINNHNEAVWGDAAGYSLSVDLTASPAVANVPYVTITDLSGQSGWFRVQPGLSGTSNLYADPSASVGATLGGNPIQLPDGPGRALQGRNVFGDTSASPGIVGAAGTTVTLTLPRGIDRITIQNNTETAASGVFALNYGVVKQGNMILDNSTRDVT